VKAGGRVPAWALWSGAGLLVLGAVLTWGAREQASPSLRASLHAVVPSQFGPYESRDLEISEDELRVAGVTDHLLRLFEAPAGTEEAPVPWLNAYVGYYDNQTRGKTIHSPKNCLPGGGWEAIASGRETLRLPGGAVEVNRYLIQNGDERVVVLYWYQGRGRVVASEYRAKWDLLRDAAKARRSEEALVRVMAPVVTSEEEAAEAAKKLATSLVPSLMEALPAWERDGGAPAAERGGAPRSVQAAGGLG